MTSVRFSRTGGPEVLDLVEETLSPPAAFEVTVRHEAIGVNFIDTYYRKGLYPQPFPARLGSEGAGVVEAIGSSVKDFKVGDRVGYATGPIGSYTTKRNVLEDQLFLIPTDISFELATAVMLKGLTVQYLFTQTHALKKDEVFLFHAAAGGVGQLACQWAKHIGAKMIGTVGSDEKAQVAISHGAWKTINYKTEDIASRVLEITQGEKLSVVYDSVGKDTFEASLNTLRPRGLFVSFGNSSGAVTGVNLGILAQKGSLYVTRPMLGAYVESKFELREAAKSLFSMISSGALRPEGPRVFALKEVRAAHVYLESRERIGSLVLRP